ncbi:hypothetical protein M0R45_009544 [Rubus argutus]|uniref:Uncharacterized protein n=1 Tax=Rubus argutus TaxID=59490 RepID=A0AAW1Y4H5_RUBAR
MGGHGRAVRAWARAAEMNGHGWALRTERRRDEIDGGSWADRCDMDWLNWALVTAPRAGGSGSGLGTGKKDGDAAWGWRKMRGVAAVVLEENGVGAGG